MRLRKIKKEFKAYDGGVLRFQDRISRKICYFEMDYEQFKPVYKALRFSLKEVYVVLSETGNHMVFKDLMILKEVFDIDYDQVGTLVKLNNKTYGICDKEGIIHLLDNMMCPEKDRIKLNQEVVHHEYGYNENDYDGLFDKQPKSNSKEFIPRLKQKQTLDFNWDEAYREDLRIFEDDEDQAEAYADDMKYKETGKY